MGVEIDGNTYWRSNTILVWESKIGITLEVTTEFDSRMVRDPDGEIFRGRLETVHPEQYLVEIPQKLVERFFATLEVVHKKTKSHVK